PSGPSAPSTPDDAPSTSGSTDTAGGASPGSANTTPRSNSAAADAAQSPGAQRSGGGELTLSGPAAPILADVDGDRAKEVVAEYRCVGGTTSWPSMILVVGSEGTVVGNVKLGDVSRTDAAQVTSWRAADGGVVVDWVASDASGADQRPYENLLTMRGSATSFTPTDRGRALGATSIVPAGQRVAFVDPTGSTACVIDGASVTCEVTSPEWTPAETAPKECAGKDVAGTVVLRDGHPGYGCADGEAFRAAASGPEATWQRRGSDPLIRDPQHGELSGLAYGRAISNGSATCSVALSGVTCLDVLTGRGFTVSPGAQRTF
ncbi:MAG: hypothetical protein ABI746_12375, partial [Dermatophilaceae bacterium]